MSSGIEPSGLTAANGTTLLQAVNQMLQAIGQAGVMSLQTENMTEPAQAALQMLSDTNAEAQSRGWHFNTDEELLLEPDVFGFINLPANALSATINPRSYPADFTWRGQRLYDRGRHTYQFTGPVYVDLTSALEFEETPQPFRWYVMASSGRKFGVSRLPDSATYKFTSQVEQDAWAALLQFDQDARSADLSSTSPHFASFRRGQRRIV
ncbi:hypothetical protein [Methylobacterium ajmalii]|jgi:hypothetical protein|uniref:hypothetical protein n=1 Tax=Methylobacterium ajmalii TaxID=2738439 RepID=UPI00190CD627|nr:hypothetical protein [Methylobacterium ajmalii]MBK3400424.1 hypothetical protein [Methylobacterium ajmalii]MBK3407534.1 hypothetical protein [Methylobacterium ajmalii]MBK3422118.1 hypothetical protein [Methylobacterium ajmalii]MBZ6416913.1 hypothetical protein [Methylobacterium sp.]